MKWKYHRKLNTDENAEPTITGTFPVIINAGNDNQPLPCGIRVVENKIFFYGIIEEATCLELNRILVEVDLKLQTTKTVLGKDFYNPIIELHINTPGGCIFSAFSTVDTIRNLTSKVHTYGDGCVASAGTLISAIGDRRFIGLYGHMLIHQLSSETYGTFTEMETELKNCSNLMRVLKDFYKKNTKLPMKKLDELMTRDIYLTAKDCLLYGIVDEIK